VISKFKLNANLIQKIIPKIKTYSNVFVIIN